MKFSIFVIAAMAGIGMSASRPRQLYYYIAAVTDFKKNSFRPILRRWKGLL